jgi:hypothetical protein
MKNNLIILLFLSFATQAQFCYSNQEIPPSTPMSNFIDNNNGTVSDITTGLMWAKCYLGHTGMQCENGGTGSSGNPTQMNWQAALTAAATSTLAGHNDWRLPNIKELVTIIERACFAPAINLTVFPRVPTTQTNTWTSSKANLFDDQAFVVNFSVGNTYAFSRDSLNYVRLVRNE